MYLGEFCSLNSACLIQALSGALFEDKIDWDTNEDDDQSLQAGPCLRNQHIDCHHCSHQNIKCRDDRISKCFIRALHIRSLFAEDEESGDGENIK